MLDPAVDPRLPVFSILRRRIALATGFLLGASAVAAVVHATQRAAPPSPPAPPPPAPAPITITAPPSIVVTIENTEVPPLAAPAPDADLGCPVITQADRPIGKRVDVTRIPTTSPGSLEPSHVHAVAASAAPVLAAEIDGDIYTSDDDGATWSYSLGEALSLSAAPDGTLYAITRRDPNVELAVRPRGGKWTYRTAPLAEVGKDRVGALADMVVWAHDSDLYTSVDRGKTWKPVRTPDNAWQTIDEPMFAWRGALYQVIHYYDECGVDDLVVGRVDPGGKQTADTFHNGYGPGEPVLSVSNDTNPTWRWTQSCRTEEGVASGPCEKISPASLQMLVAGTLLPGEGARTVAKWGQSLVELCEGGARQIYRQFPFERVAAVDWVGRPITVGGDDGLYRWSPVNGWRRLTVVQRHEKPADEMVGD